MGQGIEGKKGCATLSLEVEEWMTLCCGRDPLSALAQTDKGTKGLGRVT